MRKDFLNIDKHYKIIRDKFVNIVYKENYKILLKDIKYTTSSKTIYLEVAMLTTIPPTLPDKQFVWKEFLQC